MGKTILFVDDEAWREKVVAALSRAGYEVRTARDASQAMVCADDENLGLIMLDLNLKGESGLMLMRFLKQNHPGVPIILFSALDHDDTAIQAMLGMGAHRYLPKADVDSLVAAVDDYLKPGA